MSLMSPINYKPVVTGKILQAKMQAAAKKGSSKADGLNALIALFTNVYADFESALCPKVSQIFLAAGAPAKISVAPMLGLAPASAQTVHAKMMGATDTNKVYPAIVSQIIVDFGVGFSPNDIAVAGALLPTHPKYTGAGIIASKSTTNFNVATGNSLGLSIAAKVKAAQSPDPSIAYDILLKDVSLFLNTKLQSIFATMVGTMYIAPPQPPLPPVVLK